MPVPSGDLAARHPDVRAFRHPRRPGFADCAPSGRMRLDALACWIQDIAYADIADAGLDHVAIWVLRRSRIRVRRFPRFGERFELTTFCTGIGRMWAERRTEIVPAGDRPGAAAVEAASLWVHLDPEQWRPSPVTEAELNTWGPGPLLRRVSAHLRLPAPVRRDGGTPWSFRATERDIAGHVNNAAYWQPLEEELLHGVEPEALDVEIEYRTPAQPGAKRLLEDGELRWIVGDGGELHASILIVGDDGR